jgi:hypothetical protein
MTVPRSLTCPGPPGPFVVSTIDASMTERSGLTTDAISAMPSYRPLLWTLDMFAVTPMRFFIPSDRPAPLWCLAFGTVMKTSASRTRG